MNWAHGYAKIALLRIPLEILKLYKDLKQVTKQRVSNKQQHTMWKKYKEYVMVMNNNLREILTSIMCNTS